MSGQIQNSEFAQSPTSSDTTFVPRQGIGNTGHKGSTPDKGLSIEVQRYCIVELVQVLSLKNSLYHVPSFLFYMFTRRWL